MREQIVRRRKIKGTEAGSKFSPKNALRFTQLLPFGCMQYKVQAEKQSLHVCDDIPVGVNIFFDLTYISNFFQ